ncbi:ESX-1 secretion-associated protein [Mycobacterium sp. SMC-4]|uniref:ESX-1 secretion-associated protein n=1 Tax=Mycobacterium sp. SMC-4 TaxID=2857059 RepID=UPI0021B4B639|nr:ESX-1 secretion-associated protein [Mycobacterium sp. SMC-4]UXA19038.1 ESX-1 secretion-associated protein [Mycobacterium sp. SMC-4]
MGTSGAVHVDLAAMRAAAREYEAASSLIDAAVRNHLSALSFDGATAGRAYVAHGDALRSALETVATALRQWSRAASEIAAELHACADRYRDADIRTGRQVG